MKTVGNAKPFSGCATLGGPCASRAQLGLAENLGPEVLAVHSGDVRHRDLLGAVRLTLILIGAVAKALRIHGLDHVLDALVLLGLSLRQKVQVRDLRRDKQHR